MVVSHTCLDCVSMHKCISLWGWYMRCNISTYCMSEDCKCRITVKNCSLSGTWMATIAQLPRIGGPQSLSPSQLIVQSCPVSCEMCSCSFALHLPTCVCLHLIDIYWQITPQNCSAARAKASTVCLSVNDLTHCCPRSSGFLFHPSYDYGLLITSLTNDVDWHHYIVVLSGSLGMLIKEADG